MTHYETIQWVDYVRGLVDPATAATMRSHLDTCPACEATARRFDMVATVARTDEQFEPPAHLLRFARAAFSLNRPEAVLSLPQLAARLVFNSLDAAMAVGTRSLAEDASRQTLFEAGEYSVHLRFEQAARTPRVSLVGQIANRRSPEPPMSHVPVLLTRGKTVVARSLSNEFGEFQVEYEPHAALQLHIPVSVGRQAIRLPLTEVHDSRLDDNRSPASSSRRRVRRDAPGARRRH